MKVPNLALLACVAVLCVPSAFALAAAETVQGLLPDAPSVPPLDSVPEPLEDGPVQIQARMDLRLKGPLTVGTQVGIGTDSAQPAGADAAAPSMELRPASSQTSPVVAHLASQTAAGIGVVAFLLAQARGFEFFRLRPGSRLGQAWRWALRFVPFLPLFSRIQGNQVLENPVRARVHEVVVQDPGRSLEEVRSLAGIAWGTAVHHLRRLEAAGLLVSTTHKARRRYFAANTAASRCRAHLSTLSQPTTRRVANLVLQQPGLDQTRVCQILGLRNPAASKQLRQLASQGLILVERVGRHRKYHPTQVLRDAFAVLQPPALGALLVGPARETLGTLGPLSPAALNQAQ